MMISDVDTVFLDTNVLVYANVATAPNHQVALTAIQQFWAAGTELRMAI
jgi:predicted nucleic acid-binding protein